tara:strand:- start:379 stop:630 length:252 start_codon:yes stop_codon:yes gene_type:complete
MKRKRIKHNNLLPWFTNDHGTLPASYLNSCEKFFRELGKKRNKFQASSSNATRHNLFTEIEAASSKLQAPAGQFLVEKKEKKI